MKKTRIYVALVLAFVVAAGFVVVKFNKDQHARTTRFYPLKERMGNMRTSPEAEQVKKQFDEWTKIAGTNPDDVKSRINLASLYIQEARVTGDYMYYDGAAMKYVREVLEIEPANFEALTFQSLLYLSQHHFTEGLAIAEKARAQNPDNAFVHGILVDGNVETGSYTKAVEEADRMMSIRPDIRSYSRVSYLREIYGDYPGAIEAMQLAVDAGMPGDEATEWARVHLGHLYHITGDEKNAEMQYLVSLEHRPGYAYAVAGQAQLDLANGNYTKAISGLINAIELVNDYAFREDLADAYALSGQTAKADSIMNWLIEAMTSDATQGNADESIGHYADRELAQAYVKVGNTDKALEHALAEYNRRPANIDVNETLAWVYFRRNEFKKTAQYMDAALKTNSKNPIVLCHAGMIYTKNGDTQRGRTLLTGALAQPVSIPIKLRQEATTLLKQL